MRLRWLLLVATLALLAGGCASRLQPLDSNQGLDQDRLERIRMQPGWMASGRLAASNGEDSGQVRFRWRETSQGTDIFLRAPMGQGSWRLSVDAAGAWLEDGEGRRDWARDPAELLQRHLGWSMPVDLLSGWLTGEPGEMAQRIIVAENGAPYSFLEGGWQVQYQDYSDVGGLALPRRVEVVSGEREARLLVAQWRWMPAQ